MDVQAYDQIKSVCFIDRVILLTALHENTEPLTIKEIMAYIIRESKGQILVTDQSLRWSIEKLADSETILRIEGEKGNRKVSRYTLAQKGKALVEGLNVLMEQIGNLE